MRKLLRSLGYLAGLALLIGILRRIGWRPVAGALAQVGPGILWLALAYAAGNALMGLPWRQLMPRARRPSAAAAMTSRLAAAGLNALLPLMALGEMSRLLWLPRDDWPEGIAAMVVDRLLFMLASALAVSIGAAALPLVPGAPRGMAIAAAGFAVVLVLTAAAVTMIAARAPATWLRRALERARKALARLPIGAEETDVSAERIDVALKTLVRGSRRRLLGAFAFHVGGRILVTLEFWIALRLLGIDASIPQLLVLAAVPLALSVIAAIIPSQIGVQEGVQGLVAAAIGLGPTAGVLVVLLQRGRQILFIPVTALLLAVRPPRAPSPSSRHAAPPAKLSPPESTGRPS